MRKTTNYGLTLYDKEDKMSVTAEENSLNANMQIIDSVLKDKATIDDMTSYIESHKDELRGEQGIQGEKGDKGDVGLQGPAGKDGTNGADGQDGIDGYSPTAKVTQTDSGATITITDKNGITTANITNGKDGKDGATGPQGEQGEVGPQGEQGVQGVQGIQGEKGDKGDNYVLTDEDKQEIATQATKTAIEQTAQEQAQYAIGANLGTATARKMLSASGDITDIANGKVFVVEASVIPNMVYHIRATTGGSYALYAILDSNGVVIAKENAGKGSWNIYKTIEKLLTMPANAATLRIMYNLEGNPVAGHIWYGYPTVAHKYAGKKWLVIGDSITAAESTRSDLNYHDYVAAELGLVVTNKGQGGTGWKNREDENYAFYQRVQNITTDFDVVTIMGGANDHNKTFEIGTPSDTGTETICGCVNTTIDTVITKFLAAGKIPHLGIITPTPLGTGTMPWETESRLCKISEAIVEICRRKGIPCLDLYHCSNLRPDLEEFRALAYSKDEGGSSHPDEVGHRMMADAIRPFIESLL